MKKIRYILVALFALIALTESKAQTSQSSYFLDGAFYNYKLNPAMEAERGYFSLLLGNTSFGTKGNVGVSTFLYPYEGDKLTTFMSGTVDADEFLSKLDNDARMGLNYDMTLAAFGFRAFGGFLSCDLSFHSSSATIIPKGMFEFAKKGLQENSYSLSGLAINTMNYASFNLGYSREIINGLRVGANLKYLAGLAHADLTVTKFDVEIGEDKWLIQSQIDGQAAMCFDTSSEVDEEGNVTGFEVGSFTGPKSSGFGMDLGVEYDLDQFVPGLKLSASVVDMGFIKWKSMSKIQSSGKKVEFDGFEEIDYNDMEASVSDELDQLGEDFMEMFEFKSSEKKSAKTSLNTTMHIGAQYSMPFYKPLSVGALYSQRFSDFDCHRWIQARGYVNIAPTGWFSASVNYGYSTYGPCLGWMLNFHPVGVNFFIGSDYMVTKMTPQGIPLNDLNTHFTMGLSIAVGKKK